MQRTKLRGARTHNLRSIDLDIDPGTYLAIVGPSGAGKSSLAFRTLYAEGQRRYVESFSAYARQFLERLSRPPVDELDPVPVGIAVDRQAPVRTSRSTVGTMTEIADYAKHLWAHAAELHCPTCDTIVHRDAPTRAAQTVMKELAGKKLLVTYPVAVADKEHFLGVREALLRDGYRRVRVKGKVSDLDEVRPSDVTNGRSSTLDVVADRTVARERDHSRLVEAIEMAMKRGTGRASVWTATGEELGFSEGLHCPTCDRSFRRATPGLFSFNSPIGACETCRGFGRTIEIDLDRVIPDYDLSVEDGAIRAWQGKATTWERKELRKQAKKAGVPLGVPLRDWNPTQIAWLIDGDELGYPKGWWGIRSWFRWMESRAYKMHVRVFLSRYRKYETCKDCDGTRLKPEALAWRIDDLSLPDLYALSASNALAFLQRQDKRFEGDAGAALLWREAIGRLSALHEVGLGYLSLDRTSRTLSGGETQRVALTSALGATLNGAMFVLDEPTVGLHPRDVERLLGVVRALAKDENVAVVVEHDPEMILGADRVVELGPGAGENGGEIVFDGTPAALRRAKTATGAALKLNGSIVRARREPKGWLELKDASGHNLRGVDVSFPLGVMTCVTGVSGSGKSSLVLETLLPALQRLLGVKSEQAALEHATLTGFESLKGVVGVDQAPLGRTSRGNAATYLKIWDIFRKRFAAQSIAKQRDYKPGFFSFNVEGGRCEACRGDGAETVEMQFLADVVFSCPECGGKRFAGPVLDIEYRGLNVAQVLQLTAQEAAKRYADDPSIQRGLSPLLDVGLGYLRLGQPLNTLSGGEAQRLKLAEALLRASPGSLLICDEPTAGLHANDVQPLVRVLDGLVERGDTVIVVEHDMQIAAHADYVIDLGPGAGAEGGCIVAIGVPETVAKRKGSQTAPYLARAIGGKPPTKSRHRRKKASLVRSQDQKIKIVGAREHNLKNVNVQIPRDQLVVLTGPSGSGKSTLAFDVLFAEGQRRYLETLSPYARQYMPQLPRPSVDQVLGVPPSVSLEQRLTRAGANSTVATVTEVSHYLRLIWARIGVLHCVDCKVPISARPVSELVRDVRKAFAGRTITILAPVVRGRKGIHRELLAKAQRDGFTEARIDGQLETLEPGMKVDRYIEHDIELVVGKTRVKSPELLELLDRALTFGNGAAWVLAGDQQMQLSSKQACPSCGRGYPELDPRFFSFNTRQGQCPECEGRGEIVKKKWRGRRRKRAEERRLCDVCDQTRLSPLARGVTVDDMSITSLFDQSVSEAMQTVRAMRLGGRDSTIAHTPLQEALRRLTFLEEVGLGYLGLGRAANTLSGGEMQRVRLAAQLGSGLTGVLYVLDEPTIGLHPRDTGQLLGALRGLVERGNSVLVVEHDADTIRAADHVIDIGPGGGKHGGRVVSQGSLAEMKDSVTAAALARPPRIPVSRRSTKEVSWLTLSGVAHHNLKSIDVRFPLDRFVAVTGVSGSGKSSLIREVLLRATRDAVGLVNDSPAGPFRRIDGFERLNRAIEVDQSPIGRTPRSVPATYIGIWNLVRRLLAGTPEARARGYGPSRFSFNVEEGRCPECKGQGSILVEMAFLPDVGVPCETCNGFRFTPETLEVRWQGLNAGELLDLEVTEAVDVFAPVKAIREPLKLLVDLGLGYLHLGQASNTLSGGEAQRIKLVSELATGLNTGPTLYVMDEPTTGLHRDDVDRLLGVLLRLVDRGDTVIVIEHHPDVMLAADWVIDLGPEGGAGGGRVVAQGTPETIAKRKRSHTGHVLRRELQSSACSS
ncbi:MAG: excinuclease ABC subunit UvrA [Myxococcales bacterium]|nr:excinuclease ABC subunit UvrA [Myxococcales bacterium]MDH3483583.1 excinuclease ABC subunit UvrA [Myxococcales bacterium]